MRGVQKLFIKYKRAKLFQFASCDEEGAEQEDDEGWVHPGIN
jgi:hypothetical protein